MDLRAHSKRIRGSRRGEGGKGKGMGGEKRNAQKGSGAQWIIGKQRKEIHQKQRIISPNLAQNLVSFSWNVLADPLMLLMKNALNETLPLPTRSVDSQLGKHRIQCRILILMRIVS